MSDDPMPWLPVTACSWAYTIEVKSRIHYFHILVYVCLLRIPMYCILINFILCFTTRSIRPSLQSFFEFFLFRDFIFTNILESHVDHSHFQFL
jgi:hypothetical protein